MTFDQLQSLCAGMPGATASFPFGEEILVFKVGGKMFALMNVNERPPAVNLKCDPEWSHVLRSTYAAVQPGWHMNKQHWNTVTLDGTVSDEAVAQMVDHSYGLVVKGLRKGDRELVEKLARRKALDA
jgi:predicted DNA-binding protein (MmcQ/YjbR family)